MQLNGIVGDLFLANAHRIFVTGPSKASWGRTHDSRDLRSRTSLIAAGYAAEGQVA